MKYLLIPVFCCFFSAAKSQIHIGAKGGISIPNLEGNNEQSKGYTSRLGGYGGIVANFQLSKYLSLQPEINFSPQGGQRKGMQTVPADKLGDITLPPGTKLYAGFKTTSILNYIEIPVLAKITLGNKLKYYLFAGPHIAFLVEAKTKTSGSSLLYLDKNGTMPLQINGNPLPPVSFNATTDIKESIKTINAGLQGGLGLQYKLGPGFIFIEGRAIFGLVNIQTHPEQDGKNKTASIAAAVGYLIKLK
ncbi:MAG: PorT family protein [Chitinophagaceae bacterium]|nr:PorT family protein [Chitinophagaceae bacterium]